MSGRHVVMYSGGVGSYVAAKRVVHRVGPQAVTLLFCDTRMEDEDTYRFLRDGARALGAELIEIADGRDIWQVFRDKRYLGNTRVDPCSRILKRELSDAWLAQHCNPASTTIYVGIDWTEAHRYERLRDRRALDGWRYEAPLCEPPYLWKPDLHAIAEADGLPMQRLYREGAAHANCGGGCVKMGQGGFARLLRANRLRFIEWEEREQEMRDYLGKDVAILRDRTGGEPRPLTLRALRERIESGGQCDMTEIGGCGCFSDAAAEPTDGGAP